MRLKKLLSSLIAAALGFTALPFLETDSTQQTHAASTGRNVPYRTQEEIRAYAAAHPCSINYYGYKTEPSAKDPYAPGELDDDTQQYALNALNICRYIAGLDEVTLNSYYCELAQAGALVNAANNVLTHYPEQPAGMSDELYNLGAQGCRSCNISSGRSTPAASVLEGWMHDGDASNISRMGHRRWCLNPSMKATGFGMAHSNTEWQRGYTAMYAFNRSGTAAISGVAWPAENTPVEYFDGSYPWTISMGEYVEVSDVRVTVTRDSDAMRWSFSQNDADGDFYVDNDYYGQPGCIIFRPQDIAIRMGDVYHVNIEGLKTPVSYDVNFFSLDDTMGRNVAYRTQEEIRAYAAAHPWDFSYGYKTEPSVKYPYAPGELDDDTQQYALNALNICRYIAGLDEVTLDSNYCKLAQAGALTNAANDALTYYPEQPAGMSDELYDLGKQGCASSILSHGRLTPAEALFDDWMDNYKGSRQNCLNPTMKATGFGMAKCSTGWQGCYTVMYTSDHSGTSDISGVAWPAENTPVEYFSDSTTWTIFMGYDVTESNVRVTVTRDSDAMRWSFSQNNADGAFYVDNDYYGQPGCIIFRPQDITISKGDVYHVSIEGLKTPVSYDVNFFSLEDTEDPMTTTTTTTTTPLTTTTTTTTPLTTTTTATTPLTTTTTTTTPLTTAPVTTTTAAPSPTEWGNVDCSQEEDIRDRTSLTDAVLLARAIGDTYALTAQGAVNADIFYDGKIDDKDLSKLLGYLAGCFKYAELGGEEVTTVTTTT